MEPKITLRAVIFRSGDAWIAQCLERDIAAQAKDLKQLFYQLERAIVGHIAIAEDNGFTPFQTVPRAPQRYWTMFDHGLKLEAPKEHFFRVRGRARQVETPQLSLSDPIDPIPA